LLAFVRQKAQGVNAAHTFNGGHMKQAKRGRPPLGKTAKTGRMMVRVSSSTLEALKREAEKHNRPLSREIEGRLINSLGADKTGRSPTRALTRAIEMVEQSLARDTNKSWWEDPQTGVELREGIELFVRHYIPADLTPTGAGVAAAGEVITLLELYVKMEPFNPQPGVTFPNSWYQPWQIAHDLKGGSK
jgi:hypothetical protein